MTPEPKPCSEQGRLRGFLSRVLGLFGGRSRDRDRVGPGAEAPEEQDEPTNRLALLEEVSARLGRAPNLSAVLAVVAERGMEILGTDRIFILLEDPNLRAYRIFYQQGLTEKEAAEYRLPADHPLVRETAEELKPRVWDDVLRHPLLKEVLIRPGIRSCAAVPFVFRDRMTGFMIATSRRTSAFRAEDAALLGLLGGQVGLHIENARLQEDRARIGNMLVDRGVISREALDDVLDEQRRIRNKLDAIHELQRSIQNMRTMLEVVAETGTRLAAALDAGALIMLVREADAYELAHQFGTETNLLRESIPADHLIIQHLMKWRAPRSLPAGENPFPDLRVPHGADWIVILPVFARRELTAVAVAFTAVAVDENVLRIAEVLAVLGGIGMENIRLEAETARIGRILVRKGAVEERQIEDTLDRQEELSARKRMAARRLDRIGASETPDSILQAVEDFIAEAFGVSRFLALERHEQEFQVTRHTGLGLEKVDELGVAADAVGLNVVARSGSPAAIESLPGVGEWRVLPLLPEPDRWYASPFFTSDELTAVLLFQAPGRTGLDPDSAAILYRFTSQAGIFLHNARVIERRNRIGELLVSGGRITPEQSLEAVEDQKRIAEVEAGVYKLPVVLDRSPVAAAMAVRKDKALDRVLELLGGMERFVSEGDAVFIKPELPAPFGFPVSSDIVLIRAVAARCRAAGAGSIMVGHTPIGGVPATAIYRTLGLEEALRGLDAELVDMEADEWLPVKVPRPMLMPEVQVCRAMFGADVFITLSVAARHPALGAAPGLMGLNGILPPRLAAAHLRNLGSSRLAAKLADLLSVASPDLSLVEAIPRGRAEVYDKGESVLLGGPDAVAVDAAACLMLGWAPGDVEVLSLAEHGGLGNAAPMRWELIGVEDSDRIAGLAASPHPDAGRPEEVQLLQNPEFECLGCRAAMEELLTPLAVYFRDALGRIGGLEVLMGESPPMPSGSASVVCFGDCAVYATRKLPMRRAARGAENYIDVPGCPPLGFGWAQALARLFARVQYDAGPALELMRRVETGGAGWRPSLSGGRYAWDKRFARRFRSITEQYYGDAP